MRVVVSGSRWITNYDIVARAISESGWTPTLIVEGGARGVDRLARQWAEENGVPYKTFEAIWALHGFAAGPIRNQEMAQFGDVLVAIPRGESKGTRNMILAMTLAGKPIFVYDIDRAASEQGS